MGYGMWRFPKVRGYFFRGPHNKDYRKFGSIWGSPNFCETTIFIRVHYHSAWRSLPLHLMVLLELVGNFTLLAGVGSMQQQNCSSSPDVEDFG